MTFNSWVFAALFLIVLALHYSLAWRAQNIMLFIASLIFYGWWDWRFLGLMLFSAGVDYVVALYMPAASPQRRKALLTLSMCCNLGILGIFKYLGFFADSFARVLEALGLRADIPTSAHRAAGGDQLLHLPVDGVRHRSVSGPDRAGS